MLRSLAGQAILALILAAGATRADDVDKAEEKLTKARENYKAAMDGIRGDVLKQLEAKDAAERKKANADLAKLKAFAAEKEALEKNGEIPKWIDTNTKN